MADFSRFGAHLGPGGDEETLPRIAQPMGLPRRRARRCRSQEWSNDRQAATVGRRAHT